MTISSVFGFLRGGNVRWFIAGVVTGPLFGWLGYRWRVQRALLAGLAVAAVVCLEPSVRHQYGNVIRSPLVTAVEVATGAGFALAVAARAAVDHRRRAAR